MKKQYKIQLPKGKKVTMTNVDFENGVMTVNVELENRKEQKYEPKEGDFVCYYGESGSKNVAIFKEKLSRGSRIYCVYNTCGKYHFCTNIIDECIMRPATEAEKKLLIDKLAEVNKKWNEETRTIEDVRWRAKEGEPYSYLLVGDTDILVTTTTDMRMYNDDERFNSGNYFKTDSDAEKVAEQIRKIFKNSKAE